MLTYVKSGPMSFPSVRRIAVSHQVMAAFGQQRWIRGCRSDAAFPKAGLAVAGLGRRRAAWSGATGLRTAELGPWCRFFLHF